MPVQKVQTYSAHSRHTLPIHVRKTDSFLNFFQKKWAEYACTKV